MSKYVGFRLGKVHESHVISEYYCGGCGWPVTDHDSFCPECGGAFRECDASNLESENAKLWELCKAWRKFARELFDDYIGEPEADDDFMELDARMCELRVEGDG